MKDGKLKWDLGFFEERDFGLRKSERFGSGFLGGEEKRGGERPASEREANGGKVAVRGRESQRHLVPERESSEMAGAPERAS